MNIVDLYFDENMVSSFKQQKMYDNMIKTLGEIIEKEDNRTALLNMEQLKKIGTVYALAKELFRDSGCKVSCELHKPYKSMGYVTIEGKNIHFAEPVWLNRMGQLAHNFEVYPLTNGKVRLTFTFHGLAVPVK